MTRFEQLAKSRLPFNQINLERTKTSDWSEVQIRWLTPPNDDRETKSKFRADQSARNSSELIWLREFSSNLKTYCLPCTQWLKLRPLLRHQRKDKQFVCRWPMQCPGWLLSASCWLAALATESMQSSARIWWRCCFSHNHSSNPGLRNDLITFVYRWRLICNQRHQNEASLLASISPQEISAVNHEPRNLLLLAWDQLGAC